MIIKKFMKDNKSFKCDICGKEKISKKFPVIDENFKKQKGLNQCEKCYKNKIF